jgi:hypothetical protein
MRVATPGPARSHLLLLATLVLVLGGASVWLALGTARPLEAPALPPAATPAPESSRSPTATATVPVAPTATGTPAPHAVRANQSRNLVAAGHNNRPANLVGYLHRLNQGIMEPGFIHPTWLWFHGVTRHVYAI